MANKSAILDKIVRNMKQRGVSAVVRAGDEVQVTKTGGDVLTVTYVDRSIDGPMGGVSASTSPWLGIGVAAPGSLKVKGAAGENTIAAVIDTVEAVQLLAELASHANDLIVAAGTDAELARVPGTADGIGLGA